MLLIDGSSVSVTMTFVKSMLFIMVLVDQPSIVCMTCILAVRR